MSARDIRLAAMRLFGRQGYTATPLSAIAAAVGIKAPSLYAHFRSKEDLFRTVFDEAVDMELQELMAAVSPEAALPDGLERYLRETVGRFESTLHLPFLLRSIYLPPPGLTAHIRERDKVFAAELARRGGAGPAQADDRRAAGHAAGGGRAGLHRHIARHPCRIVVRRSRRGATTDAGALAGIRARSAAGQDIRKKAAQDGVSSSRSQVAGRPFGRPSRAVNSSQRARGRLMVRLAAAS